MTLRSTLLLCAASASLSAAVVRNYLPTVRTEQQTVEREFIKRDVVTVTKYEQRPDGSSTTTTVTTDKSKESATKSQTVSAAPLPQWMIGATVQQYNAATAPTYGLTVQRRMLGPVWLGVAADTNKTVSASILLEF